MPSARTAIGRRIGMALSISALCMAAHWAYRLGGQEEPPVVEFAVGKHGRPILVPVDLSTGERVHFLVDTGATISVFDHTLVNGTGTQTGITTLRTPAGDVYARLYKCPIASVGPLPLDVIGEVASIDLQPIRLISGDDIRGIIGMDFLRAYAFEIDFDDGKLRLWNRAPDAWSRCPRLALTERNGQPGVSAVVGRQEIEWFVVDTGANVSTLRKEVFDRLETDGFLASASKSTAITGGGEVRDNSGSLGSFQLSNMRLISTRFDRDAASALGLRHLSRFLVRFDPTTKSLYLQKGQRFDSPERTATIGIAVSRNGDKNRVMRVEPDGAARKAGIQPGDEIVAVNRQDAGEMDLFEMSVIFTSQPGNRHEVELRRGERNLVTHVTTMQLLKEPTVAR